MSITIAHMFAQTLKAIGIKYLFGVPSGSMIDYIQAIHEIDGIEFILTGHEGNAAFMAGICGRLTHIPGACFATYGPGATNLSTGVGAALLDRAPLLAFTDEMPDRLRHRTVQMNINHQALFDPITKDTSRLESGSSRTIGETLLKHADLSVAEVPGPVHIGVPSDISQIEVKNMAPPQTVFSTNKLSKPADPEVLEKMRQALTIANKPIVALGLSAAKKELKPLIIRFIEQFQIPVVLTPMAKGMVPEDHPLYVGVLNHALSDRVAMTHSQADLILGIGYDPVEINYEDWVTDVPILHLNTTSADLDTDIFTLAADVVGDIKASIQDIMLISRTKIQWDLKAIQNRKDQMFKELMSKPGFFGPAAVLEILRKKLPQNGILTCDVGAHLHLIGQKWQTPDLNTLLMTNGWSSMGFAIPAAIAAKLCFPEKKIAGVVGDGGFLMSAGELATAKRLDLDIVFVLLVDQDLSLIRLKQDKKHYQKEYGTKISNTDLFIADTFLGVPVFSAGTNEDCQSAMQKGFDSPGPAIVKTIIDPSEYDDLLLRGNKA